MHMICVYILRERKQMHHPKNKVIEINPEQLGNTLCQAEILVIFTWKVSPNCQIIFYKLDSF